MYSTYTDEELRRVLATNPKDAEALVEAADRFLAMPTGDVLEAAYEEGFSEGRADTDGYDKGYEDGYDVGFGNGLSEGLETAEKPE